MDLVDEYYLQLAISGHPVRPSFGVPFGPFPPESGALLNIHSAQHPAYQAAAALASRGHVPPGIGFDLHSQLR